MKILVATKEGQGGRSNDFGWATEGEMVRFGMECDGEKIDGRCGCRRALSGMDSHKATTTLKVVDLPMTLSDVARRVVLSLEQGGWTKGMSEAKAEAWGRDEARQLCMVAATFPVGTVLEKRGNRFQERLIKKAVTV